MFDVTGIIVFVVVIGLLVLAAKVLFVFFVVKAGMDLFQAHQRAFDHALAEQQQLLALAQRRGGGGGGGVALPPDAAARLQAAYFKASRELDHLSDLRRQQSELRLNDMRGQAASMGIFLD